MNRRAIVKISQHLSKYYDIPAGNQDCTVLYIGQEHIEYEAGPGHYIAAVIELLDGRTLSVPIDTITFYFM